MLFLVFGSTVRSAASTIAFFIFIFSCFWLYKYKNDKSAKLENQEKIWLWSVVLLNIVVLLSSYDNFTIDFSAIDSLTRLIFAIPLYFLARHIGINLHVFILGGGIGAVLMCIYAYYQTQVLGNSMATGMTDHNYFGQLSLLLTFISLCGFIYYKDKSMLKWVFLFTSFLGFYAILAASSRGVWIALPALTYLVFMTGLTHVNMWKKITAFLILIIIVFNVYINNIVNFKDRVDSVINQTNSFFQDNEISGSAGLRLEMWRSSLIMIKESYGLGSGDLGYTKGIGKLLKEGRVHSSMQKFTVEPHNYYLKTLVGQGVVGIILLFLILFIPGRAFFKNFNNNNKEIGMSAILGFGIIIGYLDFMLTNTTLDVQLMSVFFAFIIFPLYGNLSFQKNLKHEVKL